MRVVKNNEENSSYVMALAENFRLQPAAWDNNSDRRSPVHCSKNVQMTGKLQHNIRSEPNFMPLSLRHSVSAGKTRVLKAIEPGTGQPCSHAFLNQWEMSTVS